MNGNDAVRGDAWSEWDERKENSLAMHRWVAQYLKRHHLEIYDDALAAFVASQLHIRATRGEA